MATKAVRDSSINITDFLRMTPEAPVYTPKNQNYLIAGANPTFYTDMPGIQEEQEAPLTASLNWQKISLTLDGNIVAMIPASCNSANFTVFLMTSTSRVYGITMSGGIPVAATSLGFPDGSSHSGLVTGKLLCWNNTLYAGVYLDSGLYRITSFSGPTWSSAFGSVTIGVNTFLAGFLNYVAVSDGSGNVNTIDNTTFVQSSPPTAPSLALGVGWLIFGMQNYNDKYLAIAAANTNFQDYTGNWLFLWDGISAAPTYSMRIPGAYIDMAIVNSVLYVAVQVSSTKTTVYTMKNNFLVEDFTSPYSLVAGAVFGFVPEDSHTLFNFQGQLGARLTTNADLTTPLLISGNTPVGPERFILSSGNNFANLCTGTDGLLYAAEYIPGGPGNLWYYPVTDTHSYQSILYRSMWIPVDNPSGIDIRYALPPQLSTDSINVTVFGRGQDIVTGTGITTTVLTPITPTSFLNQKRTRLDLQGFQGDFIKIQLSTVNTGSWRPIIREVKVVQ